MPYPFAIYPYLRYTLALIAGISTAYLCQSKSTFSVFWLLVPTGAYCLLFAIKHTKARTLLGSIGIVFLIVTGYYVAQKQLIKLQQDSAAVPALPKYYVLNISALAEEKTNSWKTRAKIKGTSTELMVYFTKKIYNKPNYGQEYLCSHRPQPIAGPKNPGEFDYKNYLHLQGIHYQVAVYDSSAIKSGYKPTNYLLAKAYSINQYCDSLFSSQITEPQNLAVVNAMVLGLRDAIDHDLLAAYSAAGAIHVLSVSGLHVGVIMVVLVWFFGFLKKQGRWGTAVFLVVLLSFLWLYALVTGMSAPVMRSTFMFSILLVAQTLQRKKNGLNTLSFSAFCLLLYEPLLLFNVGFQLSYLAVIGMILIQPKLNPLIQIDKQKNAASWLADRLWKVTTVAVAAQIATLPLTIYYFHQFPNYFLLANPIVILLSSVALIAGLVFLALAPILQYFAWHYLAKICAQILEWCISTLNNSVSFTEQLPGAITNFLSISLSEMWVAYALIACLVALWTHQKPKYVGMASWCTMALISIGAVKKLDLAQQNIVCIHAVPKSLAISHLQGNKAHFFAENTFIADRKNLSYRLNNFWAGHQISDTSHTVLATNNRLLVLKHKKILLLYQRLSGPLPFAVDILVLQNKKLSLQKDILPNIVAKKLVLGGSFTEYYKNRFCAEAKAMGKNVTVLLDNGAITF
jgi:competence protein ComEC